MGARPSRAWVEFQPFDNPSNGPENPEAEMAMIDKAESSEIWDLEKFQDFLLGVCEFRCEHRWSEEGKGRMRGLLEERKEKLDELFGQIGAVQETFDSYAYLMQRSGFEFLLVDFAEQLAFCQELDSLLKWDSVAENLTPAVPVFIEDEKKRKKIKEMEEELEREEAAEAAAAEDQTEQEEAEVVRKPEKMPDPHLTLMRRPLRHYWWDRTQYEWITIQRKMHDFVLMAEDVAKNGSIDDNLIYELNTSSSNLYHKDIRSSECFTPRRKRATKIVLERIPKTFWIKFVQYLHRQLDEKRYQTAFIQLEKMVREFRSEMGELEEMAEYKELFKKCKIDEEEEKPKPTCCGNSKFFTHMRMAH